MILFSDDHWSTTKADCLVLPCDCSGMLNRGLVYEAAKHYKQMGICQRYSQVAKKLDGQIDFFWWRQHSPCTFAYFNVGKYLESVPSNLNYWKSFEMLKTWADRLDLTTIAFPMMFTDDVKVNVQGEMVRMMFEDWERSDNKHITMYIPKANESVEVNEVVVEGVMV